MAIIRRGKPEQVMHHSDRGIQYASFRYRRILKEHGMRQSMSRTGNCYDNALVESFFHTLKVELVHRRRYATKKGARLDVSDYIEHFYNTKRRHSSIGCVSPRDFEQISRAA